VTKTKQDKESEYVCNFSYVVSLESWSILKHHLQVFVNVDLTSCWFPKWNIPTRIEAWINLQTLARVFVNADLTS